jgi:integrase
VALIYIQDRPLLHNRWDATTYGGHPLKTRKRQFYDWCVLSLKKTFSGMKLSQISPFLIEKHKQTRLAAGHGVAANRELTALNQIFKVMIRLNKYNRPNPRNDVRLFKLEKKEKRFLSFDEEERLLAECAEPLRSIVLIGLYSGFRVQSEILTLKWKSVDIPGRKLTVEAAYAKNKEADTLRIHPKLIPVFEALRQKALQGRRKADSGDFREEYLFPGPKGENLKCIRNGFNLACERAKITGATPHSLRHSFASRLAMAGYGDQVIMKLGRWKRPEMVQTYVHLGQGFLDNVIDGLGEKNVENFTTRSRKVKKA